MTQYFYIDDTGTRSATADTPYTSLQTGTWPPGADNGNVYASLEDVLNTGKTTDIAADDVVIWEKGCLEADTTTNSYTLPAGISCFTVDGSTAIDVPVPSTVYNIDKSGGGADFTIGGGTATHIYGLGVSADDNIILNNQSKAIMVFDEVTFRTKDDVFIANHDSARTLLRNCHWVDGGAQPKLNPAVNRGSYTTWIGGSIAWTARSYLFERMGPIYGTGAELNGVNITGVTTYLIETVGAWSYTLKMRDCQYEINAIAANHTRLKGQIWDIQGCGDTTASSWQYYYSDGENIAETTSAFYADDAPLFEVDQQAASIKVITDADCSPTNPFVFPLPSAYVLFSSTSTDALSHEILSTNADLEDNDIQIQIYTKDQTNEYEVETTGAPAPPVSTGSNLTTSTVDWNGGSPASKFKYKIVTDTNGSSADGVPTGYCYVTYPNAVLYLSPVADITGV